MKLIGAITLGLVFGAIVGGGLVYYYLSGTSVVELNQDSDIPIDYATFDEPDTLDELLSDLNKVSDAPIVDLGVENFRGIRLSNYNVFLELASIGSHIGYVSDTDGSFGAMVTVDGTQYRWAKSVDRARPTMGTLSFDEVSCSTTEIIVYVRNVGSSSVTLDAVYVEGAVLPAANVTVNSIAISTATPIRQGAVATVVITKGGLDSGSTYEVRLVGVDNTQLVFSVKCD